MTDDEYRAVDPDDHTLNEYPCGVRAGDRLALKKNLELQDHAGNPRGEVIPAGSIWIVLAGLPAEPNVVWLQEPSGLSHTWDEDVLDDFSLVKPDAAV